MLTSFNSVNSPHPSAQHIASIRPGKIWPGTITQHGPDKITPCWVGLIVPEAYCDVLAWPCNFIGCVVPDDPWAEPHDSPIREIKKKPNRLLNTIE